MENRKTVLYVHHSRFLGGAPRSLALLIKELDKTRWRAITVTPMEGDIARLFRQAGSEVIVDPRIWLFAGSDNPVNSPLRLAQAWWRGCQTAAAVGEHVRTLRPDVVHLNSTSLCMAACGARKAFPGVRIVCHVRETLAGGVAGKIIRRMNHRYCDVFIALDRDGLMRLKLDGRISNVVPNFVDTAQFAAYGRVPFLREKHGLRDGDVVVVFLARLCSLNGPLEVLRMIRCLPAEFSRLHFFFVGAPNGTSPAPDTDSCGRAPARVVRPIIKRVIRRAKPDYVTRVRRAAHVMENVHLIPFQTDILPVLGSADFLLCPFTKPHFARSVVEAAAMGIPALATDIPSVRTLVEHAKTGWLYKRSCQESFEEGLRVLSFDTRRRTELGAAARTRAAARYDVHKNARATFAVYDDLHGK